MSSKNKKKEISAIVKKLSRSQFAMKLIKIRLDVVDKILTEIISDGNIKKNDKTIFQGLRSKLQTILIQVNELDKN